MEGVVGAEAEVEAEVEAEAVEAAVVAATVALVAGASSRLLSTRMPVENI